MVILIRFCSICKEGKLVIIISNLLKRKTGFIEKFFKRENHFEILREIKGFCIFFYLPKDHKCLIYALFPKLLTVLKTCFLQLNHLIKSENILKTLKKISGIHKLNLSGIFQILQKFGHILIKWWLNTQRF